jgi:hypothetical protein
VKGEKEVERVKGEKEVERVKGEKFKVKSLSSRKEV